MNEYEARQAAKAKRYRTYAENAQKRADALRQAGDAALSLIPLGQPILVGHHSEGRDRRYRARAMGQIDRGNAEQKRADYWARRADAVEHDTSISSRDPEAADKLRARIADLEAQRERIKAVNALVRTRGLEAALPDLTERERRDFASMVALESYHHPERRGYPAYVLSNLAGNISRLRKRLALVEDEQNNPDVERWTYLGSLRRAGPCKTCGGIIPAGSAALWSRTSGNLLHPADACTGPLSVR